MSSISIIGLGNMASVLDTPALDSGNAVEDIGRDAAKAADLASVVGGGATAGKIGTTPVGDTVSLALPYASDVRPPTHSTFTSRRQKHGSRGTRAMRRLRFLLLIGVLLASILTVAGCCVGHCDNSRPPIGAGVDQRG